MQFSGRNLAIGALLIVLLGVGVISLRDDGERSHTELLTWPANDPVEDVRAETLAPSRLPESVPALIMIQGLTAQRLVVWPLDGSMPPLEVDREVSMWPLLPSPDGTRVLYGSQHAVMVLNVAAMRSVIVGTLPMNSRLVYAQWSPDSNAIAYVVQTPLYLTSYYTLADGSIEAELMFEVPNGLDLDVAWLPYGDPVSISFGIGERGGLESFYSHYDPVTRLITILPFDTTEVTQTWAPTWSPDGTQQIYSTTSWDESRYKGECQTGPLALAGREWLPVALRTSIYEIDIEFAIEGLYMDRPTWLDDGQIVFRAVSDPVCTTLDSGFYVAEIGETPVKLVDAEPKYIADEADKLLWTASYALNPDQTQLAWNETDIDSQRSRIYTKPIDSTVSDNSDVEVLFETAPLDSDVAFTFQDEVMVLYFVWLP